MASARDGRTVSQATAQAWAADLEHVALSDALAGLTIHFRESTDWLLPAHVIRCAKRVVSERRAAEDRQLTMAERERRAIDAERARLIRQGVLDAS